MSRVKRRYPTAFAERNKIVLAIVGMLSMALVFLVTFNAEAMPIIGGGTIHEARFAEGGGLKKGNEVRVAGVKVGKVTEISLDGAQVVVKFRVKDVELGSETTAAVKVKTMLGQKYLALEPRGTSALDGPIPVDRTMTPYDVNAAFSDLSTTIDEIDTEKMEESFLTLADAFRDTPESVQTMVSGLTDLSRTISSRDEELAELFASTTQVTSTLRNRNDEIEKIITDGSDLLGELEARRDAVKAMWEGTASLSREMEGLVADNEKQLRPALAKLDEVTAILQRNQDNLNAALAKIGPYYRMLASSMGNGRWVDSYICGLFDAQGRPVLDNDVVRNCSPKRGGAR
ncbi:MCE family protein [Mumia zhuanghuii]|uniref:MCE family protein n=1 Tax=Mumia zhuanghuii TaxID=2585211 RepID=A0A5C4N0V2_9ACTN|nr:MCE family protein [Mumia zhuanghuii]TNC52280.1 MCE family protein [Mumia zhuanghuii]